MLSILRQMSIEEQRYAAAACGAGTDATPEGILRALCRECMVLGWGFVPLTREDALFEQVGTRLGLPPGAKGPAAVPAMERRVFRTLLRRAWEAADASYQRCVLEEAAALWDAGGETLPELPPHEEALGLSAALERYLAHPAGLRALAAATEVAPLVFPRPLDLPLPQQITVAVGQLAGLRPRPDRGYAALFEVLLLCWRARRRLLLERQTHLQQLERQLRQLTANLQRRAQELRGTSAPSTLNWRRGIAVAGGAAAATFLQLALHVYSPLGWLVGGAGLIWSAIAAASHPRLEADPRYAALLREIAATRQQLAAVRTSLAAVEGE
jgi:hypothetical protein